MSDSFKHLVEEIVAKHHSFLRKNLPAITELLDELAGRFPDSESLQEGQQLYKKVRSKIELHLTDEETVLFPTGIALETGATIPSTEMDLRARLAEMEREHDGCGNALGTVSQFVCTVPQSDLREKVLQSIQAVQDDLCVHVEKENTEVHPRFLQLLASGPV